MVHESISREKYKICHSERYKAKRQETNRLSLYKYADLESSKFRTKQIAIVGAGPAGCICAKILNDAGFEVTLFDRGKYLRTLLPTGGGRCNLAHAEYDFKELAKNYPRGEKFLYSVFSRFGTSNTIDFFNKIGIKTYTQSDNRIFPASDSSADVREKLLKTLTKCKFRNEKVIEITPPSAQEPLFPNKGKTLRLKTLSRSLRKNMTPQEIILWQYLRKKQFGVKFRRQHPINDKYIADFACLEKKLIIEVDGSQHIDSKNDIIRTIYLENEGYEIIRFYNNDIDNNIEGCLEYLKTKLNNKIAPLLSDMPEADGISSNKFAPFQSDMPEADGISSNKFAPFQGEMPKAKGVTWKIKTDKNIYSFDYVVIAIGGHSNFEILKDYVNIIPPTQALVGLITKENFSSIAGVSVNDILFTHKGISGPKIYKISSINARKEMPYKLNFELIPNFNLQEHLNKNPHKEIKTLLGQFIPKSLALWILQKLEISPETSCHQINGKTRDKILNNLTNFEVTVIGKVPDGEVVTCGGVDLKEINSKTLESKQHQGLYFCGEVLDIDGFCGGFNLQNCWSTGFIAAQSIIDKNN